MNALPHNVGRNLGKRKGKRVFIEANTLRRPRKSRQQARGSKALQGNNPGVVAGPDSA
jgi:hypothetical protein